MLYPSIRHGIMINIQYYIGWIFYIISTHIYIDMYLGGYFNLRISLPISAKRFPRISMNIFPDFSSEFLFFQISDRQIYSYISYHQILKNDLKIKVYIFRIGVCVKVSNLAFISNTNLKFLFSKKKIFQLLRAEKSKL